MDDENESPALIPGCSSRGVYLAGHGRVTNAHDVARDHDCSADGNVRANSYWLRIAAKLLLRS